MRSRFKLLTSKLQLGPELITLGDFSASTGWTLTGQMAISGGQLTTGTGGGASDLAQRTDLLETLYPYHWYRLEYSGNFGSAAVLLGQTSTIQNALQNGHNVDIIRPLGSAKTIRIRRGSASDSATLDFISLRRIY